MQIALKEKLGIEVQDFLRLNLATVPRSGYHSGEVLLAIDRSCQYVIDVRRSERCGSSLVVAARIQAGVSE
jgi:hypothetical protein